MDAGQFDRRITLQSPVLTRDDIGGFITNWETVATVWAKRLGAKGREIYAAGREIGAVDEAFQIRFSSQVEFILPTWRLIYKGQNYNITSAVEVGRHEFFSITCKLESQNTLMPPQWVAGSAQLDVAIDSLPE